MSGPHAAVSPSNSPAPKTPPLVLPPLPIRCSPAWFSNYLKWSHPENSSFSSGPMTTTLVLRHSLALPCPGLLRRLPSARTWAGCPHSLLTVMSAVVGQHAMHMKGRTLSWKSLLCHVCTEIGLQNYCYQHNPYIPEGNRFQNERMMWVEEKLKGKEIETERTEPPMTS